MDNVLQELDLEAANYTRVTFKSVKILHNQTLTNKLNAVRRDFIDTLIDNLTTRFPHEELELLECFDIVFYPRRYPKEQSKLAAYGTDQLNILCDHYSQLLDADRCKAQFLQFKHFVMSHTTDCRILTVLSKY